MVSLGEITREHSGHVTGSIGGASRYEREDKPDAIGLDASVRQPGCTNGGRPEDNTERPLMLASH